MLPDFQKKFKNDLLQKRLSTKDFCENSQFHQSRFSVYHNTVFVSLKEVLFSVFSATAQVVSHDFFRYLTDEYIKMHPPQSGCLDDYGQTFTSFIQSFEATKKMEFLPDLTRLEWLVHTASLSPAYPSLTEAELTSLIEQKHSAICLQPSLKLIHSPWAISQIYELVKKDTTEGIDIKQKEHLAIYRSPLSVHIKAIDQNTFHFLKKCMQKSNYIDGCEYYMENNKTNIMILNQSVIKLNLLYEHKM